AAKKSARQSSDGSAGGFKGGMPSRPSRSEAPPPARQEQSTAKKFSFPFRRKNWWRAQNQNRNENFFVWWRASARGGGAERQFRSKKVRAFSNKGRKEPPKGDFCGPIVSQLLGSREDSNAGACHH
ncbi:MAG: hypothetical protein CEN90_612, partial [Parcubacteria group bacterium Licking1014_17]